MGLWRTTNRLLQVHSYSQLRSGDDIFIWEKKHYISWKLPFTWAKRRAICERRGTACFGGHGNSHCSPVTRWQSYPYRFGVLPSPCLDVWLSWHPFPSRLSLYSLYYSGFIFPKLCLAENYQIKMTPSKPKIQLQLCWISPLIPFSRYSSQE